MPKQRLNLTIDREVVEMLKIQGVNISELVERFLKGINKSEPREGFMIGRYTTGAKTDKSIDVRQSINTYKKQLVLCKYSKCHLQTINRFLDSYLIYCQGKPTLNNTIDYLKMTQDKFDEAYYNKQFWQIKKLLMFIGFDWANKIPIPKAKYYSPLPITDDLFFKALEQLDNNRRSSKQVKCALLLARSSGLRSFEIYGLDLDCINIEERMVYVKKQNGVKNLQSIRTSFFGKQTQDCLIDYIKSLGPNHKGKLFHLSTIEKALHKKEFLLKHGRHLFVRNATMNGCPIVGRLIGHASTKSILDRHYLYLSDFDCRNIYDKFGGDW